MTEKYEYCSTVPPNESLKLKGESSAVPGKQSCDAVLWGLSFQSL